MKHCLTQKSLSNQADLLYVTNLNVQNLGEAHVPIPIGMTEIS